MKRSLTSNGFVTYSVRYQAERCEGCPLRDPCFKARGNRIIEVNHQLQQYKQKARELLTSKESIKHRGQRCIEPEAVFGQTKYNKTYKSLGILEKTRFLELVLLMLLVAGIMSCLLLLMSIMD